MVVCGVACGWRYGGDRLVYHVVGCFACGSVKGGVGWWGAVCVDVECEECVECGRLGGVGRGVLWAVGDGGGVESCREGVRESEMVVAE